MQTSAQILEKPAPQAQAAVVPAVKAGRLAYLDTIKVILICLVIALHTAITYGSNGDWTYRDPANGPEYDILLSMITGIIQAFSLGLYFFLAGFLTPKSYDRKGVQRFWLDRVLRLALPMVLYTWALNRIPVYVANVAKGTVTEPFGSYFARTWLTSPDEGPTWFIFALLLFTIGYTLWRLATRPVAPERMAWISQLKTPGKKAILGYGLLVGALMFVIGLKSPVTNSIEVFGIFNMMVVFFAQYILFYIAGALACRNEWLKKWDAKDLRFWSWLTAGLFLAFPTMFAIGMLTGASMDAFMGGLGWQAAAFMLWVGLFSVSISMTLILWLRGSRLPQGRLFTFANPNSYAVYLIHPIVLIPVSVLFAAVPLISQVKFLIVLPIVLVLTFLIADGLRRIPGVKAVL